MNTRTAAFPSPTPLAGAVRQALGPRAALGYALTLGLSLSAPLPATALGTSTAGAAPTGRAQPQASETLVVIDAGVADSGLLARALAPGQTLVRLDASRDGLAQLGEALRAHPGVRRVHLFAHGEPGGLKLGNAWVRQDTLEARTGALSKWFAPAAGGPAPELLLYGCDVAADAAGVAFVERLAALTGARVAASDDLTGARSLGGNWVLEHVSHPMSSAPVLTEAAMRAYPSVLASIDVNSTLDNLTGGDGSCTLREAINNANANGDTTSGDCAAGTGDDTVVLGADTYALAIVGTSEELNATGDLDARDPAGLTIQGAGQDLTTVDGSGIDRVFHVVGGARLTVNDATVTGGREVTGGGIFNGGGTLNLNRSTVSGNSASSRGGGLHTDNGTSTLTDSTVSGNSASADGGGISAGVYFNGGNVTLERSTVSGNTAGTGGGISAYSSRNYSISNVVASNSTISGNRSNRGGGIDSLRSSVGLTHSTVTGNTAGTTGGGIYAYSYLGSLTLRNTIVSGNSAPGAGREVGTRNTAVTSAFNVLGHSGDAGVNGFAPGGSDIVPAGAPGTVLDPVLADNGGLTETHALVPASPALDAADAAVCTAAPVSNVDQRGVMRGVDADGTPNSPQTGDCDVGAFELELPTLTLTKVVVNDDGGGAGVNDFGLTIGATPVDSGDTLAVAANTPVAIDEAGLAGYAFVSITGDGKCPAVLGGTVTLDLGEDIACTVTNDDVAPSITLTKAVVNDDGGSAGVNDFGLTIGATPVNSGDTLAVAANTPVALDEAGLAGYAFVSITGDGKCPAVLGGTVTLDPGEDIACTVTNDDVAPSITLTKAVVNDHGGSAGVNDFGLTIGGTPVDSGDTLAVTAGTPVAIDEALVAGYAFVDITGDAKCPAAPGGTVTLGLDEHISCTMTNDDLPATLIIEKRTVPAGSPGLFSFSGAASGDIGDGEQLVTDIAAGAHTVTEDDTQAGFTLTDVACDDADSTGDLATRSASVNAALGETVTCTFTNTARVPASSQPGSALIAPFTLQANSPANLSVLRLVNNHPTDEVRVHLVRVCGAELGYGGQGLCTASNREVALTHNEARVLNVRNFFGVDPESCDTGYVLAYAVDPALGPGQPVSWNHLSGSLYVRTPGGPGLNWTMGTQAFTVQSPQPQGAPIGTGGAFPQLPFNGIDYRQLPTLSYTDFVASAGARGAALWLMTLDVQAGASNPATTVAVDWWNEAEDVFSTSHQYVCQTRVPLDALSTSFTQGGLGSFYGNLRITPAGSDAVIGFIEEVEPNRRTLRPLFHDNLPRMTTFTGR